MDKTKTVHPAMSRVYDAAIRLELIDPAQRQAALARLLNTSSQAVKNWEIRGPSKDIRLTIQNRFGINASWVETGEGEDLLPPHHNEAGKNPPRPAHMQPAKNAAEPGAVPVLSPAEHALIDAARPLSDDDLALLTQIAQLMARWDGGPPMESRKFLPPVPGLKKDKA